MMPCPLSFSLIELLHESNMAEEVGFEPTDAFTSTDFKSAALSRSAIPPKIIPASGLSDFIKRQVAKWYSERDSNPHARGIGF